MEKRGNFKKVIIISIIAALIISVSVTALILILNSPKGYFNISVKDIVGDVTVENNGDVYKAYPNMRLTDGFTMTTASESYSHMMLDDDKYSKLDELSRAKFESIGSNGKTTSIFLEYGQMTNEITRPLGPDEEYLLATPNAVLSVRGTIYITKVTTDENGDVVTEVFTFGGRVSVHRVLPDGTKVEEEVDVPAGYKVIIKKDEETTYYVEEVDDNIGDNIDPIDPTDPTEVDDEILLIAYDAAVNGHQLYCEPEVLAEEIERRQVDTTEYISYHTGRPLEIRTSQGAPNSGETAAPEETAEPGDVTITGDSGAETAAPETDPEETDPEETDPEETVPEETDPEETDPVETDTEPEETTEPPEETTVSDDETTEPPGTEKEKETTAPEEKPPEETTADTTEETTAETTAPESEEEETTTTTPSHSPQEQTPSGPCTSHKFSVNSVHGYWYNRNERYDMCMVIGKCEKCGKTVILDDLEETSHTGSTHILNYTLNSGENITFTMNSESMPQVCMTNDKLSKYDFSSIKGGTYNMYSDTLPFISCYESSDSDGTPIIFITIYSKEDSRGSYCTVWLIVNEHRTTSSGEVWSFDFIDQHFELSVSHTHTYAANSKYTGEFVDYDPTTHTYRYALYHACDQCGEKMDFMYKSAPISPDNYGTYYYTYPNETSGDVLRCAHQYPTPTQSNVNVTWRRYSKTVAQVDISMTCELCGKEVDVVPGDHMFSANNHVYRTVDSNGNPVFDIGTFSTTDDELCAQGDHYFDETNGHDWEWHVDDDNPENTTCNFMARCFNPNCTATNPVEAAVTYEETDNAIVYTATNGPYSDTKTVYTTAVHTHNYITESGVPNYSPENGIWTKYSNGNLRLEVYYACTGTGCNDVVVAETLYSNAADHGINYTPAGPATLEGYYWYTDSYGHTFTLSDENYNSMQASPTG